MKLLENNYILLTQETEQIFFFLLKYDREGAELLTAHSGRWIQMLPASRNDLPFLWC